MKKQILGIALMAILGSSGLAAADDSSLLVGTWRFESEVDTYADGTPVPGPSIDCDGILIYTADGFMSVNIMPKSRKWSTDRATAAELLATITDGSAYAGRYEVNRSSTRCPISRL